MASGFAGGLIAAAALLLLNMTGERGDAWIGFAGSVAGGLFTVFAAWIAWRSVQPQINEARRQSAANAVLATIPRIRGYEEERAILRSIQRIRLDAVMQFDKFIMGRPDKYGECLKVIRQCRRKAKSFARGLEKHAARYPAGYRCSSERQRCIDGAAPVIAALDEAIEAAREAMDGLENEAIESRFSAIDRAFNDAIATLAIARREHARVLREICANHWHRIRELEDFTLGLEPPSHSAAPR